MAYEDWMPEFQEIWDSTPADYAGSQSEIEMAEFFFEEGFMTYSGEASPADIQFARESFAEFLGFDDYDDFADWFDWQGWREAMGYE